jgi:putative restriction endonuclease
LSSGPKPEQPFLFLRNDGFWNLHFPAGTPERARVIPNVTSLRDSACHASLDPDLYQRLADPELRAELTGVILNQWWPETIQADLITRLGLETRETGAMASRRSAIRSAEFRIRVLENYRHKCTMCGFAVLLNGQPFGLEAAHIRAIQFKGPDQVDNGFALCRIHHVLFDRGAVSVDDDQKVILSQKLIVQDDELFRSITSSRGKRIAKAVNTEPKREYMRWHRSQVFLE